MTDNKKVSDLLLFTFMVIIISFHYNLAKLYFFIEKLAINSN